MKGEVWMVRELGDSESANYWDRKGRLDTGPVLAAGFIGFVAGGLIGWIVRSIVFG